MSINQPSWFIFSYNRLKKEKRIQVHTTSIVSSEHLTGTKRKKNSRIGYICVYLTDRQLYDQAGSELKW